MAGYYDATKDYSAELKRTDLTAAERSQLETERQNKINAVYGGVEPNMTGSNKTYSQAYGSSSKGSSSGTSGGSVYGVANNDTNVKNSTQNGVTYQTGADMSRRPDLAGKIASSNGYTVFYDEDGYATKAIRGAADYTPTLDTNAANGSYGTSGAWTDNEMLSAADRQKIAAIRAQLQTGQITGDQANQAANAIRAGYGYSIDKNGYVTDSGALSAVNDFRKKLGLNTGNEGNSLEYYRYLMNSDTSPSAQQSGQVQSFDEWVTGGKPTGSVQSGASLAVGLVPGASVGGNSSMTDYINDLYAQNLEAELQALKSAYDSNVAEVENQNEKIAEQYRSARNQAAANNALESQQMRELGIAQGLNTGATGQMALAQSAAYQNNLGNLWASEAQDQADVDMTLANLLNEYNSNVQQTTANSNAQRAQALYQEMVRQQNLAAQNQSTAREYALSLLSNGIMPDDSTLNSAGISSTEASALAGLYQSAASYGGSKTGKSSTASGYNNRNTVDSQTVGETNADVAGAVYQNQDGGSGTRFSGLGYQTMLARGDTEGATAYLASLWDNMTDAEKTRARLIAAQYGGE